MGRCGMAVPVVAAAAGIPPTCEAGVIFRMLWMAMDMPWLRSCLLGMGGGIWVGKGRAWERRPVG